MFLYELYGKKLTEANKVGYTDEGKSLVSVVRDVFSNLHSTLSKELRYERVVATDVRTGAMPASSVIDDKIRKDYVHNASKQVQRDIENAGKFNEAEDPAYALKYSKNSPYAKEPAPVEKSKEFSTNIGRTAEEKTFAKFKSNLTSAYKNWYDTQWVDIGEPAVKDGLIRKLEAMGVDKNHLVFKNLINELNTMPRPIPMDKAKALTQRTGKYVEPVSYKDAVSHIAFKVVPLISRAISFIETANEINRRTESGAKLSKEDKQAIQAEIKESLGLEKISESIMNVIEQLNDVGGKLKAEADASKSDGSEAPQERPEAEKEKPGNYEDDAEEVKKKAHKDRVAVDLMLRNFESEVNQKFPGILGTSNPGTILRKKIRDAADKMDSVNDRNNYIVKTMKQMMDTLVAEANKANK